MPPVPPSVPAPVPGARGLVRLSAGGGALGAATDLPLRAGAHLRVALTGPPGGRMVLRPDPPHTDRPGAPRPGAGADLADGLRRAGMTGGIAAALTAALAEAGAAPDPADAAPLAARAGASGVTTPAQATAFARLSAAGLPTRPAAVTGFADLLVGMPVGRALAALIDAARSGVPATTPGGAEVRALGDQLARLAQRVAHGSVSGDGDALRRAVADLGADAGTRTTGGEGPGPSVRALLGALASAPADPALARAAAGLADALGAQPLAGPAGGSPPGLPEATHEGVYLQLPLPGGGTAQVRVDPDGPEGGGGARGRRVALLLDLSALGRVMITATTGEGAVDARVRAEGEDARAFLAARSGELARALGGSERPARVRVEAVAGPVPERLLAPPPALAVDRRA